jgi:hypothetical protein
MALTHADLAAQLVAQGALAIAKRQLPAKMPVEAVVLDAEERKRIAANPGELAVFYPVGDSGVFLELGGAISRVWYEGVDAVGAIDTLDRALGKVKASRLSDSAHEKLRDMKRREYRVDLDAKHFVKLSVTYPANKAVKQAFVVQLFAQEKRG